VLRNSNSVTTQLDSDTRAFSLYGSCITDIVGAVWGLCRAVCWSLTSWRQQLCRACVYSRQDKLHSRCHLCIRCLSNFLLPSPHLLRCPTCL
jgi:hypothetical protein